MPPKPKNNQDLQPRVIELDVAGVMEQNLAILKTYDEAQLAYRNNVGGLQASPTEAENWYFASDPTGDSIDMIMESTANVGDTERLKEMTAARAEESFILGRGGMTVLASVLYPEAFQEAESGEVNRGWLQRIAEIEGGQPGEGADAHLWLAMTCAGKMMSGEFKPSHKDMPKLLLAGEMLKNSAERIDGGMIDGSLVFSDLTGEVAEKFHEQANAKAMAANKRVTAFYGVDPKTMKYTSELQDSISYSLLNVLADMPFREFPEDFTDREIDEAKMAGLEAQVMLASTTMSHPEATNDANMAQLSAKDFVGLISNLQKLFAADQPISQRIKSSGVKGPLHEILWFMDAYAMRRLHPVTYGDIVTIPTPSREDAPRIGYPEQKRGLDMRVVRLSNGVVDLVQLKSSASGHKRRKEQGQSGTSEYHPTITELAETNFMEVDPRRLRSKLENYKRWAENGFDPSMDDTVKSYIMRTVWDEFDTILTIGVDATTLVRKEIGKHLVPRETQVETVNQQVQQQSPNSSLSSNSEAKERKKRRKAAKNARKKNR